MFHLRRAAKCYKMQFDVLPIDKCSAVDCYLWTPWQSVLTAISPQRTEHLSFSPILPLTSCKIQTLFSLKLPDFFRFPIQHSTHISPRHSRVVSYNPRKLMKSSQISLRKDIACLLHRMSVRLLYLVCRYCSLLPLPNACGALRLETTVWQSWSIQHDVSN